MTRDRGSYGPGDRDRNWIIRWGADQTADYVRDQTVGAALRPAMPVIGDVFRGGRGAKRMWTATQWIGGRAEADKPAAQIGHELFHGGADRDRALSQISTNFRALTSDLAEWLSTNYGHPDAGTVAQWIAADVTPMLAEWGVFVADEKRSWWRKIATSWDTFEQWAERLKQLRSLARAHGVKLHSAEPVALPKTIWQHSEAGKGSEATAILGVLKIGALTALSVMGAAGLYSAIRGLRSKARGAEDRAVLREIIREEIQGPVAK